MLYSAEAKKKVKGHRSPGMMGIRMPFVGGGPSAADSSGGATGGRIGMARTMQLSQRSNTPLLAAAPSSHSWVSPVTSKRYHASGPLVVTVLSGRARRSSTTSLAPGRAQVLASSGDIQVVWLICTVLLMA